MNNQNNPMTHLLTVEGYFKRFFYNLQHRCKTHKEAYEILEIELEELGFPSRYGDYNSFKRGKSYHLAKVRETRIAI